MKRLWLLSILLGSAMLISFIVVERSGPDEKGIDLTWMDQKIRPQDDFFAYANGGWLAKTPIPGSESVWGSFGMLRESNQQKLKDILFDAAAKKDAVPGSNIQKIGDFFASGMDSVKRNKDRYYPLKPDFDQIDKLGSSKNAVELLRKFTEYRLGCLFYFTADQDLENSNLIVPVVYQGGLGLPDPDYYTRNDDGAKEIRKKYIDHLQKMFKLIGYDDKRCVKTSQQILNLETEMAKASLNTLERRDIQKQYNKLSVDSLQKVCPNINWKEFFGPYSLPGSYVVVSNPRLLTRQSELMETVSLDTWKDYYKWVLLNTAAPYLSDDLVMQDFDFYERTLHGVQVMQPRWKRCLEATDRVLGEALGQVFVEKYFSAEAKKKVNEMVDYLLTAFEQRIKSRDWMSEETKTAGLEKLGKITRKLGYPDKVRDYSALTISRESFLENYFRASKFEFKRQLGKLGKEVDKTEWGMSPPTINAYYNPGFNEIVFPAGIMQYPFFDAKMDMALNFGAMGAVIGHEITHGFDDQGAQFDANGNFKMWWKQEDYAKFKEKSQMLVKQFDQYVAIDTFRVKGQLTLGENIADLGGLTMAYKGMKLYYAKHPEENKPINGFTPEQRFFFGWAKVWCIKHREEALKQRLITDVHAPGKFRVNGPFSNLQEFYDAFGVKEGDKLWRPKNERAEIW